MPDHSLILTIGCSSRGVMDFLELLQKYEIAFLTDIRSTPYSQLEPDFDKDRLAANRCATSFPPLSTRGSLLISLMQDQGDALRQSGVAAASAYSIAAV